MISSFGRTLAFLTLLFLIVPAPRAQDTADVERKIGAVNLPQGGHAIPYPNGALYVNRGISGAFLGGRHKNVGDTGSLYQWQGDLGYFYKPWLSGGLGFRITAGEPSSKAQKIFNRYFINLRAHHSWNDAAAGYVGVQFGVGNLNLLTDSASNDTIKTSVNLPKGLGTPIKNTKPTMSLDLGVGWRFSKYVGFTLGNNLEYSLVDEEGVGTTNGLNLHVNPGLALDLLAFSEGLRNLVPAMFVNIEFQSGFLIFEKNGHKLDQSGVLGVSLAF